MPALDKGLEVHGVLGAVVLCPSQQPYQFLGKRASIAAEMPALDKGLEVFGVLGAVVLCPSQQPDQFLGKRTSQ
ncbi:hypothetical protein NDU88_000603 [Pleurodeles waltl]|uniref:Uncharacterized protein n=1 Tax=Pleurodeles waltl TaxID=8319 RepID=A0AAV7S533_PLEWA|nr:hypothetical protein NDU88_000603 [Pleurodeles waltl]